MKKMIETMPGCEPIILDKVPTLLYCGGCMTEMRCSHGNSFACPICGMDYKKETVAWGLRNKIPNPSNKFEV